MSDANGFVVKFGVPIYTDANGVLRDPPSNPEYHLVTFHDCVDMRQFDEWLDTNGYQHATRQDMYIWISKGGMLLVEEGEYVHYLKNAEGEIPYFSWETDHDEDCGRIFPYGVRSWFSAWQVGMVLLITRYPSAVA